MGKIHSVFKKYTLKSNPKAYFFNNTGSAAFTGTLEIVTEPNFMIERLVVLKSVEYF